MNIRSQHLTIAIIASVFFILGGCKELPKQMGKEILSKSEVTIAGRIDAPSFHSVSISFYDLVRNDVRYTKAVAQHDGTFTLKIDIYHAQDITFTYGVKSLTLYVEPNDSLFLTFSDNDFGKGANGEFSTVRFLGPNAQTNSDLLRYNVYRSGNGFEVSPEGLSVTEFLRELSVYLEKGRRELDAFTKQSSSTEKFMRWASVDLTYGVANYLIEFEMYAQSAGIPLSDSLFTSPLFPVHNEEGPFSSMYSQHLQSYAGHLYFRSRPDVINLYRDEKRVEAFTMALRLMVNNEPSSFARDAMAYLLLKQLLDESPAAARECIDGIDGIVSSHLLMNEIEAAINSRLAYSGQDILFMNGHSGAASKFNGNPVTYLLELSRSRIVYVDVWATWCAPCIDEIPSMLELHPELEKFGVEVVSFCCRSDMEPWLQVVRDNGLLGQHFLFNRQQTKELAADLGFRGFPTYMILKDGEIIHRNAPRPSQKDDVIHLIKMADLKR